MYEEELKVAVEAVREAGKFIKENYGKHLDSESKESWQDIVTKIDMAADNSIITRIKEKFPNHNIDSEESRHEKKESEFTWYIDPLDGTTNYVTQVPFVCIAVGLLKNDEPVLSVIYNPISDELFTSSKDGGAFLNGKPIAPSKNTDIKKTMINFCHMNTSEDIEKIGKVWSQLKQLGRDLRRLGSGNLDIAFVTCGRNDAYFSSSKIYDIAPSLILAKESGCKITDWYGNEWNKDSYGIIITNGTKIHDDLVNILSNLF